MSQSNGGVPPFRVVYSGLHREQTRQLLARAAAKGRSAEIANCVQNIHNRLQWHPLDFGEPLSDLMALGIQARIATIAPLVVRFGVDEVRRIVYVLVPFGLLPKSGL